MSGIGEGRLLLSEEDRREYERSTGRQTLIDTVSGLPHFYDRPEFAYCSEKRARYRISNAEEPDAIGKILFGRRTAVWNYVGTKEYPCRIAFDLGLCEGDSGFVLGTPENMAGESGDYLSRVTEQFQKREAGQGSEGQIRRDLSGEDSPLGSG